MNVQLSVQGTARRVLPEVETILFRITQEALTNAARHSLANQVEVSLSFAVDKITLQVQDNGRGFDPETVLRADHKQHWGLLGIEERVSLVGGESKILSQPGEGTKIVVNIPLQKELAHV
jgi:signal transduction histidine kinase